LHYFENPHQHPELYEGVQEPTESEGIPYEGFRAAFEGIWSARVDVLHWIKQNPTKEMLVSGLKLDPRRFNIRVPLPNNNVLEPLISCDL